MKTEKEILKEIKNLEISNCHVLNGSMATLSENALRSLMQLAATSKLDSLYFVLGKTRPKYEHEGGKRKI